MASSTERRGSIGSVPFRVTLAGIVGVGLGVALSKYYVENQGTPTQLQRPPATEIVPPLDEPRLLEGLAIATPEDITQTAFQLINESESLRTENARKGKSKEEIQNLIREHVLKEAVFYHRTAISPIIVPVNSQTIDFSGRRFNLSNQTDLTIAQVLTEAALREKARFPEVSENKGSINPLMWSEIASLQQKVTFEGDISTYGPYNLAWLSRGIHALESAGRPIPSKIHRKKSGETLEDNPSVLIANVGFEPIFELANFSLKHNPEFFEEFKRDIVIPSVHPDYLNPAVEKSLNEQAENRFRRGFYGFFQDGNYERGRILREKERSLYPSWQNEYAFWRRFFGGVDFSINGKQKQIEEYEVGNEVEIDDFEAQEYPDRWGVYLRPNPRLDRDPAWPYTRDKWRVKIVGGPETVYDNIRGGTVRMFMIEQAYPEPESGWVPEEVLGKKIA